MSVNQPTTVLLIQNGSGIGGAGESLDVLVSHLNRVRFRPVIWTGENGPLVERWQKRHVEVVIQRIYLFEWLDTHFVSGAFESNPSKWQRAVLQGLNALRAIRAIPREIATLRRLRNKYNVRLVHINSIVPVTAGIAARLLGLPVVWHVREILANNMWARLVCWLIRRCAIHIIAISKAAARPFNSNSNRVSVLANAVDVRHFTPLIEGLTIRKELDLSASTPVVGFVGKLYPSKGIIDLILAAPMVREKVPNVQFLIVGSINSNNEGMQAISWRRRLRLWAGFGNKLDYLKKIKAQIHQLDLMDCMHFVGSRHDVPRMLAAMDVVVIPSRTEAFGRTIIEAMAMAKPVVASAVDAIPEIIIQAQNGLLCNAACPTELADAILSLLKDRSQMIRLGNAARISVLEKFSAEQHVARVESVYEKVVALSDDTISPSIKNHFTTIYEHFEEGKNGAAKTSLRHS